jgi:hypothetical protein
MKSARNSVNELVEYFGFFLVLQHLVQWAEATADSLKPINRDHVRDLEETWRKRANIINDAIRRMENET